MKGKTRLLSFLMTISILVAFALPVSAGAQNQITGDSLWVNAGGSTYSEYRCTTNANRSTCYMRLSYFKFNNCPDNAMPGSTYIYSRLYTYQTRVAASNNASFTGVTSAGNYNYSYLSGYGGYNTTYTLKCNSSYSLTGYWATFDWCANPYV